MGKLIRVLKRLPNLDVNDMIMPFDWGLDDVLFLPDDQIEYFIYYLKIEKAGEVRQGTLFLTQESWDKLFEVIEK